MSGLTFGERLERRKHDHGDGPKASKKKKKKKSKKHATAAHTSERSSSTFGGVSRKNYAHTSSSTAYADVRSNRRTFDEDDRSSGDDSDELTGGGKNRPLELSSKVYVPKAAPLIGKKSQKAAPRDPRFSDLSGSFTESKFRRNYQFVDDIQKNELSVVEKRLRSKKHGLSAEEREALEAHRQKLRSDLSQKKANDKRLQRKMDRVGEERKRVAQGKKPYYMSKAAERREDLEEKFKELKDSGRLERYMSRKRKREASRDLRHKPERRRTTFDD